MNKMTFSCGDKVIIKNKNQIENGIVCQNINTNDVKEKVRILTNTGIVNKLIGDLIKTN